eukprot:6182632-Pyramimonas_sp.AAC.1
MHIISDKNRRQGPSKIRPKSFEKASELDPKQRWKGATGITRAMVNTMLDLGWTRWGRGTGSRATAKSSAARTTALDGNEDTSGLKQAIASTIEKKQRQQAAKHYAGCGLEQGVDMRSAKARTK